jgi:hypothetical protein
MGRQYSSKDFFRQMPNELLARYLHSRGLLPELTFRAMLEGRPGALAEAIGAFGLVGRIPTHGRPTDPHHEKRLCSGCGY